MAGRGLRGFVSRQLARPYALIGLAAGLLLAIVLGINLGNATVEGINPIHFQPPAAPRLREPVLDEAPPAPLSRRLPSYSEIYGWEEGQAAYLQDCGAACSGDGSYSASVPYFGSREELEATQRRAMRIIDRDFAEETADAMRRERPDEAGPLSGVVKVAPPSPADDGAAINLSQE
jgi:hypothetical protein